MAELSGLYNIIITAAFSVAGWFMRKLHSDINALETKHENLSEHLAAHKQHVAENYITNQKFDKIESKLDRIYDILIKKDN